MRVGIKLININYMFLKTSHYYFIFIALFVLTFTCYSCHTTRKEAMNHFVKGKIVSIDTSANNDKRNSFVIQLDSSNKKAVVIIGDKLMLSPKLQQLKKRQYIKIKGYKIKYIDYGKENKHAANTYIIDQLNIMK